MYLYVQWCEPSLEDWGHVRSRARANESRRCGGGGGSKTIHHHGIEANNILVFVDLHVNLHSKENITPIGKLKMKIQK